MYSSNNGVIDTSTSSTTTNENQKFSSNSKIFAYTKSEIDIIYNDIISSTLSSYSDDEWASWMASVWEER